MTHTTHLCDREINVGRVRTTAFAWRRRWRRFHRRWDVGASNTLVSICDGIFNISRLASHGIDGDFLFKIVASAVGSFECSLLGVTINANGNLATNNSVVVVIVVRSLGNIDASTYGRIDIVGLSTGVAWRLDVIPIKMCFRVGGVCVCKT